MSARPAGTPVPILLVEDSPGDVRLTQEALRDGRGLAWLGGLVVVGRDEIEPAGGQARGRSGHRMRIRRDVRE